MERLDMEFANDHQEYVDNEKEKQMIEREMSEAKERLDSTGKYMKLLQFDNAKLTFTLGTTKDKLQHSKSLQLVHQVQVHEKEIKDLEGMIVDLMGRINKAKSEIQSIGENMKVLTRNSSELSTKQMNLQEKKCKLLATLRQHEENLNRALQVESSAPHPPPEKEMVLINSSIMPNHICDHICT